MAEPQETPAPPFDTVPSPDEAPEGAAGTVTVLRRLKLPRGAWIAVFVVAAGFGQGIGLTMFFGGGHDRLTEVAEESSEKAPANEAEHAEGAEHGGAAAGDEHGSDQHGAAAEESHAQGVAHEQGAAAAHEDGAGGEADPHPTPAPDGLPRELVLARERLELGDVAGARRLAADFLLRQDGLEYDETRFTVDAYARLGDVLRHEYERSLGEEAH